jgi:hypothetical protein
MVYQVNSHTHATRIGWHLWEIDFRFAPGLHQGWCTGAVALLDDVAAHNVEDTGRSMSRDRACDDGVYYRATGCLGRVMHSTRASNVG